MTNEVDYSATGLPPLKRMPYVCNVIQIIQWVERTSIDRFGEAIVAMRFLKEVDNLEEDIVHPKYKESAGYYMPQNKLPLYENESLICGDDISYRTQQWKYVKWSDKNA
eukprot:173896_1